MDRRRTERVAASVVFAYEVVALWTPLPTISAIARRCPWVGAVIVGGLSRHFLPPRRP